MRTATYTRQVVWAFLAAALGAACANEPPSPGQVAVRGRIAFASSRSGDLEIYSMNTDGSDVVQLTDGPATDEEPAWSPDGRHIAFASNREGGVFRLYSMASDGSGVIMLTDSSVDPAWSRDGSRIAGERAVRSCRRGACSIAYTRLFVMNADGSDLVVFGVGAISPSWAPDGRLAFVENGQIAVMSPDGSGLTVLTNDPDGADKPAWSPDGTKIAFWSIHSGVSGLYVMNADGTGVTALTHDGTPGQERPAWSPDGTRIAFASDRDGDYEIYVMNADGSGVSQLTDNRVSDTDPAWSP